MKQLEQKEKYIEGLKENILGVAKNDPINVEPNPPVQKGQPKGKPEQQGKGPQGKQQEKGPQQKDE